MGVIEASTYTQRSGSERFTPLDPLEVEIFTAMQKPNDWYNYVLDDCITVHDHINFHRQKHSFDELKKAVGGLLESPQEERVQRAEVIKKMIQNSVDSAFYRKYIHHILRQAMDIKDDVLMSSAPQVPMTVKSRLFAAEPLEAERRLLGKVGFGRMTVDELLASLNQPEETTPAIETVDYEKYVVSQ